MFYRYFPVASRARRPEVLALGLRLSLSRAAVASMAYGIYLVRRVVPRARGAWQVELGYQLLLWLCGAACCFLRPGASLMGKRRSRQISAAVSTYTACRPKQAKKLVGIRR